MGSIQTITSSSLSLLSEQSNYSRNQRHHLKTLDIGFDGNTVSTNLYGDVFPPSLLIIDAPNKLSTHYLQITRFFN